MDKTVKAYLDTLPEDRRAMFMQLHELVLELFPDATVDMSYKMPTYRHGDGWVAIANQKQYVSLYTCGEHHLAAFRDKHPEFNTGKGCIRFRSKDTVPAAATRQVIRHAMQHPKQA